MAGTDIPESSHPATRAAIAEYLRDPVNLLSAVADAVAKGIPLSNDEAVDLSQALDDDKANVQKFLVAYRIREMARVRNLSDAFDSFLSALFSAENVERIENNPSMLLLVLQFLAKREEVSVRHLVESLQAKLPNFSFVDQSQNLNVGLSEASKLPPDRREKLRGLLSSIARLLPKEPDATKQG